MRTNKQPERTREMLLEAAFEEMHRTGFQAARVDRILDGTGVTKGALYHHFAGKQDLGCAVVDEAVRARVHARWVDPLVRSHDVLLGLEAAIEGFMAGVSDEELALGCPFFNLMHEMSPLDEAFRGRLASIFQEWRDVIARGLSDGQAGDSVRSGIDPHATATFLIGALAGILAIAKLTTDRLLTRAMIDAFLDHIDALRPDPLLPSP